MKIDLKLPPFESVPSQNDLVLDRHTRLIYHPISGLVYKRRFTIALRMLAHYNPPKPQSLLEVGYGAGLLFPVLSSLAQEVWGLENHGADANVAAMIERLGIRNVRLRPGSVLSIPFEDERFDSVLCLSVLEHIVELDKAIGELYRVIKKGGVLVLGFPVKNILTRGLFRLLGYDDDVIHPSSHSAITNAAQRQFRLEKTVVFPFRVPMDFGLYAVIKVRK